MWSDRRADKLLRRNSNHVASDWLSSAQHISGRSRCSNRSIFIVNVVDIGNVRDVGNGGDVPDVGGIDDAQVIGAVVVPGEERFTRPEREPCHEIHTDAD
jgi:hypothetical protein